MDINLTIDNFLNTLFGDVDLATPGEEETILGMCFYQSIKNKVFPAEFEANITNFITLAIHEDTEHAV